MGNRLSVISPVYNEEAVIEAFYRQLAAELDKITHRYNVNILFVVDRSSDRTLVILKRIAAADPRVGILAMSSRFGHQMSLLAGIDHCDADALIMMDADLQHPPAVIPRLLEEFERGAEVVFTIREDTEGQSWIRRRLGNLFYSALSRLADIPIHENAADFRLISGRVVKVIREGFGERRLFLRGVFGWIGFRQSAITFKAAERGGGHSKYTMSKMLALATAGILSFSTRPLHLALFVGLAFGALGVVMMGWVLVEYFRDASIPSGWTTLTVLQLMFSAIQLFCLGIVGAYIGGIYDQVRARPYYIIDEALNVSADVTRPRRDG